MQQKDLSLGVVEKSWSQVLQEAVEERNKARKEA